MTPLRLHVSSRCTSNQKEEEWRYAHAAHAGMGNDELDSNSLASGERSNIERLIVDPTNNQAKGLCSSVSVLSPRHRQQSGFEQEDQGKNERRLTLATASSCPETFKIRSGLPGMDSETVTRALLFSCCRQH